MLTELYSWCTSLGDKLANGGENTEFVDYYSGYFVETSICSSIFLTGMGIALAIAAVYYFGICNFVFNLAKRWVWGIVLALVFVVSLFTTIPMIIGEDTEDIENATGIFANAHQIEATKLNMTEDSDQREEISQIATDFREQFKQKEDSFMTEEDLPMEMAITNGIYSAILFIILSFLFKRHTRHGSAIPL